MTLPPRDDAHRETLETLPWLATGRLDEALAARVTRHLESCAECRVEWHAERELHRAMRTDASPDRPPHQALARLEARIDFLEREQPDAADRVPAAGRRAWPRLASRAAWAAAAAAALMAGAWLAVSPWTEPRYATATSRPAPAPGIAVRLVAADGLALRDFEDLLRERDARVVDGPSAEGAWTAVLPGVSAGASLTNALERWRRDPRVRLAEPVP